MAVLLALLIGYGVGGFGFDFGASSMWAAEFHAAMAPGSEAQKFGTMWLMVLFSGTKSFSLALISAFLAEMAVLLVYTAL